VAKASVKRSLFSSLRSAVSRTISSTLGGSVAGRVAYDVSGQVMSGAQRKASYSASEVQATVIKAFEKVQDRFRWDSEAGRWVGLKAASAPDTAFSAQLSGSPVAEKYDRGVLARMLTEIACIDGNVSDDEREFLGDFIDPELGTVDELAERDRLSAAELGGTDEKARETMLMLAWTVAMTDKELADEEKARLEELAAGLGIEDARSAELAGHARDFLLDQAFAAAYPGGNKDAGAHAEAMSYATAVGLSQDEAEVADVRYRKRAGIV
jgi:tellurite resistance protein